MEKMTELLTIFTPTYNRANLLPRLYESLKKQSSKNFIWMVIDDGSTDDTEKLVNGWIDECKDFRIEYYKKENGGLQSGYVKAIEHLNTDLAMCIDSDDRATSNAVELIEKAWAEIDHEKYAGFYGLDCYENGDILGGYFEKEDQILDLIDFAIGKRKRTQSDRALVIRSNLYKQANPAKRYPGERTMNATYLHLQISERFKFVLLNKPLIEVEYQADGLSSGKKRHYISAPNTFADWRLYMLGLPGGTVWFYFRNAIHYVSSCIFAKRKIINASCPKKMVVVLSIPLGLLLNMYLRLSVR